MEEGRISDAHGYVVEQFISAYQAQVSSHKREERASALLRFEAILTWCLAHKTAIESYAIIPKERKQQFQNIRQIFQLADNFDYELNNNNNAESDVDNSDDYSARSEISTNEDTES